MGTALAGAAAVPAPPAAAQHVESSGFKAGFADRDISPDVGMEQPGGYGKVFHRSFHDPCKVRVAVFDDGRSRVALVGVDALMVPRSLVTQVRGLIHERCGIPQHAVLIGASHSHSSGPVGMIQPGEYDSAPPLVRQLAYEKSSCADPVYLDRVRTEIVAAVLHANSVRTEARCGFGSGTESKAAFNRRHRMKNGLSFTHPGRGNPDMLDYAGPIDPQVGVVAAWDRGGRMLGCIVNYACHATTSPGGISANWIYYLEKVIRGAMAADAPVVFLQGACGDVTQVNNLSPYAEPAGERSARYVGGRVGAEAVKVMLGMTAGDEVPLDAKSTILRIARRIPNPEHVQRCRELVAKDPKEAGVTEWTFAKEIVMLDYQISRQRVAEVEVQAVQIGPAVFVTNPAELFCQFGLDVKAKSPFPLTFPVELANGCVGYVPTEEALGPHGGGYETRLTSYSNLEPAAGRRMVEAGLTLAGQMQPGKMPEPPKAPPFKGPWTYGNVPPELS